MAFDEDRHRENLERWASTDLPLYGVDGWPGTRGIGSHQGLGSGDRTILMTAGVRHHRQDVAASVTVTSSRQQDDGLAMLRQ